MICKQSCVLCVVGSRAADVHVHKAVGDSLDLIADYPKEGLVEVRWKYNGKDFAVYENDQIKPVNPPLFQERLKLYKDNISITLLDLKLQDSGKFSIVAEGKSGQLPTKVFVLHVHGEFNLIFILSVLLECKTHIHTQELALNKL